VRTFTVTKTPHEELGEGPVGAPKNVVACAELLARTKKHPMTLREPIIALTSDYKQYYRYFIPKTEEVQPPFQENP
jgi:hypothetical protein